MKKCKYCQTDIPKKAKVCPNCKRTLKGGGCGCLVFVLTFIIFIVGGIAMVINMNSGIQKSASGVSNESEYMTMEEYNKIDTGMKYEEVVEIVGSSGESMSKSETNGIVIEMFTWYGNGIAGSNANVTFKNGEVMAKAQVGLK